MTVYYLIERNDRDQALWARHKPGERLRWVTDAAVADQYDWAPEASAQMRILATRSDLNGVELKITEHMDVAPIPEPPKVEAEAWEAFRLTGLLWFVNRSLQLFGWSIAVSYAKDGTVLGAFPLRTPHEGFAPDLDTENFIRIRHTMTEAGMERIVRAAIMVDGAVWSVPEPGRHHDVIAKYNRVNGIKKFVNHNSVSGFMTSRGRFVDREEAMSLATAAGQTESTKRELYSEDVWGSPYYQRLYAWAMAEIATIEADPRFGYAPADVRVNAPLAIEQIVLKTRHKALTTFLSLPVEEQNAH